MRIIWVSLVAIIVGVAILTIPVFATTTGVAEANPRLVRQNTLFQLSIKLTSDEELSPLRPAFPDPDGVSLSNREFDPIEDLIVDGGITRHIYIFTAEYYADEAGIYNIGPFKVTYSNADGDSEEITVESVVVEVYDDAPRPASDIIEGIIRTPWKIILIIFLIGLLLALVAAFIINNRRSVKTAPGLLVGAFHSPEQEAFEEIRNLSTPDAEDEPAVKEYYDSVDEILRKYLFKRYNVSTRDSTNWEIQREFHRRKRLDSRAKGVFVLLNDCDWVKFAKSHPDAVDISKVTGRAADVLLGIKPQDGRES